VCSVQTVLQDVTFLVFFLRTECLDVPRKLCVSLTRKIKVPTLGSTRMYEMLCQSKSRGLGGK